MKATIFVLMLGMICVKQLFGTGCPNPRPQGMVYCNDFDNGATTTPQRLVDLQPNAWAGGCNNPEPSPCPNQLNGYGPAYIVYYDDVHKGVVYESLCTRRSTCGTANIHNPTYSWLTRVNYAYSKNAFFKLERPDLIGKVHDGIDFCNQTSCASWSGHAGVQLGVLGIGAGFDGWGTYSCNFGQPTSICEVKDITCTDFNSCISTNWFWLRFYYEVTPTAIQNITGILTRCNLPGVQCETTPFLTVHVPPITDQNGVVA